MKLLVFGQSGQVARALAEVAAKQGVAAHFLARAEADLTDPEHCAGLILASEADVIINAAAFTQVDDAEQALNAAQRINADAPGAMARAAAVDGRLFLHLSTDYVFGGDGDLPWRPADPTDPINTYGRTKRDGEEAVRAAGGPHVILRTAWVFSPYGCNFVKTMLRLGAERDRLSVVADQVGGPTPARAIAEACLSIAHGLRDDPSLSGTYHFSGGPDVSWADFARAIMDEAGLACRIEDIPTSAWPTAAQRPLNSRLDCRTLEAAFGITRPDWRAALRATIADLGAGS